jgi:hypothetical protein
MASWEDNSERGRKMKRKGLKTILCVAFMAVLMCGCGNTGDETESTAETTETVVEETDAEEEETEESTTVQGPETEEVQEEPEIVEETTDTEEIVDQTSDDVWKTVKETDDICMVVINESQSQELVMNSKGIGAENIITYVVQKGDKIYIPLRDNIRGIFLDYCDRSSEFISLYSFDSIGVDYPIIELDDNLKALEVEDPLAKDYNIKINIEDADDYVYFLIGYDNN